MQTYTLIRLLFHHIHFSGETGLLLRYNWHQKDFKIMPLTYRL